MKDFLSDNVYYAILAAFLLGAISGYLARHFNLIDLEKGYREIEDQAIPIVIEGSTVNKEESCSIYVDVSGAVQSPGVYCFQKGNLYIDAVNKASGFTRNYAKEFVSRNVNLSNPLENHGKIYIPFEKDLRCEYIDFRPEATLQDTLGVSESKVEGCVNLNTGTLEELKSLSGIGEAMAIKIMDGRPYKSIDDLDGISGIGEKLFSELKSQVCI